MNECACYVPARPVESIYVCALCAKKNNCVKYRNYSSYLHWDEPFECWGFQPYNATLSVPNIVEQNRRHEDMSKEKKDPLYTAALKTAKSQEALDRHQDILDEIHQLYKRKNADYGDSFHKTFLEEGWAMARIRLSDKLERFKVLSRGKPAEVKDESMRDTLIDLANYAILTVMEYDRLHEGGDEDETADARDN